jgi:hypothetical protein
MLGVTSYITSGAYLFAPKSTAVAGTYSPQLEARVDTAGTTMNLIQSALTILRLGT